MEFENNLMCNLAEIRSDLINHTYTMGVYREFKVYEPKERDIKALRYRDRVVQRSLCDNILVPYLYSRLDYDNVSCQEGKGTHFALDRLSRFMREGYNKWGTDFYGLKCDVRKYFYSIHHEVLRKQLFTFIEDEEIRWLLNIIIDSTEGEVGLPIGNMTSQWFAVLYLDPLDKLVRNEIKPAYYTRYMDDFILIDKDKRFLQDALLRMREFLGAELGLELNEKTQIFPIKNGVDYLGFHSYLTETGKVVRKIRNKSKKRMKRRIRKFNTAYAAGDIEYEKIQQSIASWLGHAKHGDTYHLRKCVMKKVKLIPDEKSK